MADRRWKSQAGAFLICRFRFCASQRAANPRAKNWLLGIEVALKMQGMLATPVIETQALSKQFGRQRALDWVSLKVEPGTIGLLGPNGAGKSTLMKCLLQLLPMT